MYKSMKVSLVRKKKSKYKYTQIILYIKYINNGGRSSYQVLCTVTDNFSYNRYQYLTGELLNPFTD